MLADTIRGQTVELIGQQGMGNAGHGRAWQGLERHWT